MQYTLVFYSSAELREENVKVLKNYITDGLIFCDMDKADIKNSKFNEVSILICGSETALKHWAKQWSQAEVLGYDFGENIFYINIQSMVDLEKKIISIEQAKEFVRIDGQLDWSLRPFQKAEYICNNVVFWKDRKSLFSKLIRGPILSAIAASRSHGTATVINKEGEEQIYHIPKPSRIPRKFGIQALGVTLEWGNDGRTVIQLVPDTEDFLNHKLVECAEIKTTEKVIVVLKNSTWIVDGVCEIVAPRQ